MWQHLSDELNYNVMFSPRGAMFLGHNDGDMIKLAERGDAMRCDGIDAELLTPAQIAKIEPLLDLSRNARFPIDGALIQRRGGTARHDAVAWGYARAADALGVDIIQKCEVIGFVRDQGKVIGVETTRGRILAGRTGICVAGHSGQVAGLAGLRLPVEIADLAGARHRRREADGAVGGHVAVAALLHQPVRQGRHRDGRRSGQLAQLCPARPADGGRGHAIAQAVIDHARALAPAHAAHLVGRDGHELRRRADHRRDAGTTDLFLNGGWRYGGFKATPASGWTYAHTLATGKPHALNAPFSLERLHDRRDDRRNRGRPHAEPSLRGLRHVPDHLSPLRPARPVGVHL